MYSFTPSWQALGTHSGITNGSGHPGQRLTSRVGATYPVLIFPAGVDNMWRRSSQPHCMANGAVVERVHDSQLMVIVTVKLCGIGPDLALAAARRQCARVARSLTPWRVWLALWQHNELVTRRFFLWWKRPCTPSVHCDFESQYELVDLIKERATAAPCYTIALN